MGRFIKEIQLNQPIDVVSMVMDDFVYHNHFFRTDWNGEMVFGVKDKHGKDWYLKWSYTAGVFHLEAWIKGVFGGEAGLGGSSGRVYRRELHQLLSRIHGQSSDKIAGGHVGSDPLHHEGDDKNHEIWRQDTTWQGKDNVGTLIRDVNDAAKKTQNTGISAVILAALAIFCALQFPIVSLILLGISRKKAKSTGLYNVIKIMNIVAGIIIVGSVFVSILNILTVVFY